MEKISTGLNWNQVQESFDTDKEYIMSLELRLRRASLGVRKKGLTESRKVWRLIIQRDYKNYIKTIIRKNIRLEDENMKEQELTDKQVIKLNNLLDL